MTGSDRRERENREASSPQMFCSLGSSSKNTANKTERGELSCQLAKKLAKLLPILMVDIDRREGGREGTKRW